MKKITTENFIARANDIHNNFYDYSLVDYVGNKSYVKIICPIHGEFEQTPFMHTQGSGCWDCGYLNRAPNKRMNTEQFIIRANKVHNNFYDYSKVEYKKSKIPVKIICPKHGEFQQTPDKHLNVNSKNDGRGCPECGILKCAEAQTFTTEMFLKEARLIHGNKYDYSLVKYIKSNIDVIIICPMHGKSLQSPNHHLNSSGCSRCGWEIGASKTILSQEEAVQKFIERHGNKYDYSKVIYINQITKVEIICPNPKHGSFWQTPNSHSQGRGCSHCTPNVSGIEIEWLNYINVPQQYRHKTIKYGENNKKWFFVDAYDPNTNTIYEFHGDLWHGNPRVYDHKKKNYKNNETFGNLYLATMEKERILKAAGYNLVIMWEKDFKEIKRQNKKLSSLAKKKL